MKEAESSEAQILMLWIIVLRQQAEIAVHADVLEKLLAKTLQGQRLRSVYAEQMKIETQKVLASVADSLPNMASQIAMFLEEADRQNQNPPTP